MPYLYLAEKLQKKYPNLVAGKDWDVIATSDNQSIDIVWRVKDIPEPTKEAVESAYTDSDILLEREAKLKADKSTLSVTLQALISVLATRFNVSKSVLLKEVQDELKK